MSDVLTAFQAEVRRGDAALDLGRAALLIAAGEYHNLPLDMYLELLDRLAQTVAARLPEDAEPRDVAHGIARHLFHEMEFRGNQDEYYDPRNSYLSDVLIRRRGIPISLSVTFLEVGRRLGLEASGVNFPQHFLVKYHDGGGHEWFIDPFNRGEEFAGEDLRGALSRRGTVPQDSIDYYLSAATRRQVLTRMLTNLKMIYHRAEDWERALRVQEYLLAISPWSFADIRDRGLLRARLGDRGGALADLDTYLQYATTETDIEEMRRVRADIAGDS